MQRQKASLRRALFGKKWTFETEERNECIHQGFAEKGLGQVQPMRGSAATLVLGCGPSPQKSRGGRIDELIAG